MINDNIQSQLDQLTGSVEITDTRCGPMMVYTNDTVVSRALILLGEYSHAEILVMNRFLTPQSLYVDVGTNIGYHARSIAVLAGCQVIGFEPLPKHFALAAYNTQGLSARIYNAAVGNANGQVSMDDIDPTQAGNYGEAHVSNQGVTVPCVQLDSVPELQDRCNVIKIDVEGFELEVLQGAQQCLAQHRPVVFFEALEHSRWDQCRQFLQDRDYKMYWATVLVHPDGGAYKPADSRPFGRTGSFNILAVPSEQEQPTDLVPVQAGEWYQSMVDRMNRYRLVL